MHSIEQTAKRAAVAAALIGVVGWGSRPVWAQGTQMDVGASMVQRPQAPASGASAGNPDNMPIKRPNKPTRDPIARRPPASDTQPK
ncbi:hypothetical protein AB1286_16535 [Trinickia sp. NRRL B-1857]|uniref:hypothetical protein n=1 Tax=Trinickia sp. NRRL B-1857 TaxID=3162879 RepID=UPI003D2CE233